MDETLRLKAIWQIKNVRDYKVHFGRWNGKHQPLDLWVEDEADGKDGKFIIPDVTTSIESIFFRLWISIMKAILGCLEESFVS